MHESAGLHAWKATCSDWFSPISMKRKSTRNRQLVELGIEFVYSPRSCIMKQAILATLDSKFSARASSLASESSSPKR